MSVRCAIGLHRWKPRYRFAAKGVKEFTYLLLGVWPPVFFPMQTGSYTNWPLVGEQCVRCKARRA